jgi:simple sugar transport system ATP-binding protein
MELLRLEGIAKSFGKARVLQDIDLAIDQGEVVALVGDNGAGKSTLIKIITGVHRPSAGRLFYRGEPVALRSVAQSRQLGIEAVYQERALCDQQALYRNIFAGREIVDRFGFMNIRRERAETEKLLRSRIGLTSSAITVDSPVGGLSGGEKQGVAFVRALYFDADLIILDEPTMGLSIKETERVLDFVKGLIGQGKSAIFIDHNIFHVYDAATRFVILDRGRIVAQFGKAEISHKDLIATMVELHNKGQAR